MRWKDAPEVGYSERTLDEQISILAEIDGVTPERMREHACSFFCWARMMEQRGYSVGALKPGRTIFDRDQFDFYSLHPKP